MSAQGSGIPNLDENTHKKRTTNPKRRLCVKSAELWWRWVGSKQGATHTASREGKAQLETDRDRTEPTARQGRGAGGREGLMKAAL